MLSQEDLKQICAKGISEEKIETQLQSFKDGFPFLKLEAAASIGKGIVAPDEEERKSYIDAWNAYKAAGSKIVKFVPASGAASRMFKDMFAFVDADYDVPTTAFEKTYFSNITKRLVKTPKMYFMDTGLAAYLCRWPNAETHENGAMDGAFYETRVVTEILKSYYNAGIRPDLYYYRDLDKREVDLLIIKGEDIYPIEIKKGAAPEKAGKNFGVLGKLGMKVNPGLVICSCESLIPYSRDIWYCPISIL